MITTIHEKLGRLKGFLLSTAPNPDRGERTIDKNTIVLTRYTLKKRIMNALDIIDNHTVNNWITKLISEYIIEENPHSSLSPKAKIHKPSDDTRYFVHLEFCRPTPTHTLLTRWTQQDSQN